MIFSLNQSINFFKDVFENKDCTKQSSSFFVNTIISIQALKITENNRNAITLMLAAAVS